MTVASEIARIQGVKSNILNAIAAKGVTVPSGAMLADCPSLISSISGGGGGGGGGGISADNIVNIIPIDKMVVVDSNGYIGFDFTNYFQTRGATFYYNYAILSDGDDFSNKGLGQVTFYTPSSNVIGGRTYRTAVIGGVEWLAENLDFKFSGLAIGQSRTSSNEPRGNYYDNDETSYGINGNKYGLFYNWTAVKYLDDNKSTLIPGWHVPTKNEWDALVNAVGGNSEKLKSKTQWSIGNGTDDYMFSVYPSGCYDGNFVDINYCAYFWSLSLSGGYNDAYRIKFDTSNNMDIGVRETYRQLSLRLVKDIPSNQ